LVSIKKLFFIGVMNHFQFPSDVNKLKKCSRQECPAIIKKALQSSPLQLVFMMARSYHPPSTKAASRE
jgi:hypothetical protein